MKKKCFIILCIILTAWLCYPILPGEIKDGTIPYGCIFQDEINKNSIYDEIGDCVYLQAVKELNDKNVRISVFEFNDKFFALEHNFGRLYYTNKKNLANDWNYIDLSTYGIDGVIKKDELMYYTTGKRYKRFCIPYFFIDGQAFRVYRPQYYVFNFETKDVYQISKKNYFQILNIYS